MITIFFSLKNCVVLQNVNKHVKWLKIEISIHIAVVIDTTILFGFIMTDFVIYFIDDEIYNVFAFAWKIFSIVYLRNCAKKTNKNLIIRCPPDKYRRWWKISDFVSFFAFQIYWFKIWVSRRASAKQNCWLLWYKVV